MSDVRDERPRQRPIYKAKPIGAALNLEPRAVYHLAAQTPCPIPGLIRIGTGKRKTIAFDPDNVLGLYGAA
jgi:hypothetical protein